MNNIAIDSLAQFLEHSPQLLETYSVLQQFMRDSESGHELLLEQIRAATELCSSEVRAVQRAGEALLELGCYSEANQFLLRAHEKFPGDGAILARLADSDLYLGNMEDAYSNYKWAVAAEPALLPVLLSFVKFLLRMDRPEEAQRIFRDSFEMFGDHFNKKPAGPCAHRREIPLWRLEPLAGKTVLLRQPADLANGDMIQFMRCASLMKKNGAKVIVECRANLCGLVRTMSGVDHVVEEGENAEADFQTFPAAALLLLEWTWESLAAQIPFVYPPHHCTGRWKSRLPASGKLKIGLNWAGHPLWQLDKNRYRSVQLRELAPIARIPEVELYSLQFGEGVEQLADAPFRISDLKVGDFLDTAAAVQALDLIITVDSALVHVAGAVGKRCLVMLPFISCWRWMLDRSDCPQYPSLRLFRQCVGGDWSKPIAEIAAVTAALAGRHNEHSLAEPGHES